MQNWLDFPTVTAPSHEGRSKAVTYAISKVFVERYASINRRTPILQLWTHVVGLPPPINNIGRLFAGSGGPSLTSLHKAVACFQGIKRPHIDEPDGDSVLVYVLNPLVTVVYDPDLACVAKALRVPKNTVLTVHVCLSRALLGENSALNGTVTRLEYVSSGEGQPTLPVRHDSRYTRNNWRDNS